MVLLLSGNGSAEKMECRLLFALQFLQKDRGKSFVLFKEN